METIKNKMKEMEMEQQQFTNIDALKVREDGRRRQVEENKGRMERVLQEKQNLLKQIQNKYAKMQV